MNLRTTSTLVRCLLLMTVPLCAGAVLGCTAPTSSAAEEEDPTSTVASPIIYGNTVYDTFADGVPMLVNSALVGSSAGTEGGCSGVLLSNNYILTAGHCVATAWPTNRTPVAASNLSITLGTASLAPEQRVPSDIFVHPTLDAAVLHVNTPLPMNGRAWGYWRQLSTAHQNLPGTSVRCLGYGSHAVGAPMGGLASAAFTVQSIQTNEFIIPMNQGGQAIWFGDSGGPCLMSDGSLIGIAERLTGIAPPTGLSSAQETAIWGLHPWIDTFLGSTYRNPHVRSILWNDPGGPPQLWRMDGMTVGSQNSLPSMGSEWKILGTGDFDGDGEGDILWQSNTGEVLFWFMSFGIVRAQASPSFGYYLGTDWTFEGIGDFNRDLHSDIVWRHKGGQIAIWEMSGTNLVSGLYPGAPVDSGWKIQGIGDFEGDHHSDILWRHDNGTLAIWHSGDATDITYPANPPTGTDWQVAGVGDFDGNGKSDILWRYVNGYVAVWHDADSSLTTYLGPSALDWTILGTGDFNGNARADILWQQPSSGAVAIWPDGNVLSAAFPGNSYTAFRATLGNSY